MEPKNSLEALDNLVHCKSETKCKECHHKNVCTLERDYNTIKQDLEEYEEYKDQWSSDTHCWIEDNIGTFYVIDKDKEIECRLYELPIFNELLANVDKLLYENQELKQDIQDVIADYQDAARKMFKYIEAIDEILEYLKLHNVSIDFLSDVENIVARAGYYE